VNRNVYVLEDALLDTFAASALQGLLAYSGSENQCDSVEEWTHHMADMAYKYADAMLRKRIERGLVRANEQKSVMTKPRAHDDYDTGVEL
jgi:hypothetical protein